MYNGLTTADKGALLDAQKFGARWIARDWNNCICGYYNRPNKTDMRVWSWTGLMHGMNEKSLEFVKWEDAEPVNIDLALAQIAEMERAEKPQEEMTIHGYSIRHLELIAILMRDHGVTPEDVKEAARNYSSGAIFAFNAATEQIQKGFKEAVERMHSPYTEGATK